MRQDQLLMIGAGALLIWWLTRRGGTAHPPGDGDRNGRGANGGSEAPCYGLREGSPEYLACVRKFYQDDLNGRGCFPEVVGGAVTGTTPKEIYNSYVVLLDICQSPNMEQRLDRFGRQRIHRRPVMVGQ